MKLKSELRVAALLLEKNGEGDCEKIFLLDGVPDGVNLSFLRSRTGVLSKF